MEDDQDRVEKDGGFPEDHRPEITWVCKECGKVFSSGQAYGGHKRIHNQQVNPAPVPVRGSSSSTVSATEGSSVNLIGSVKGIWGSTGMRGRAAITQNSGAENRIRGDPEDNRMNQAGSDLMPFDKIPQPCLEDPDSAVKSRHKRKLDDESKDPEFICDICQKQFSSEAALKEHVPSHNFNWWALADLAMDVQRKCNDCDSIFPTGQALGEHRVTHHLIGSPAGNSSQGTGEGRRQALELNLNDPPPEQVKDSHLNAQSDSISD